MSLPRAGNAVLPTERGGWWHEYVCPAHGVELEHVGLLGGTFPDGGVPCRYGCVLDTLPVRGAWTVLAHQACARRILQDARSDDSGAQTAALRLLDEYARLYLGLGDEHQGAQRWMLRGRLFHQALTEAIWAVSVGRAANELTAAGLSPTAEIEAMLAALAGAAERSRNQLVSDGKFDSNYVAWLNAAGAVCSSDGRWLTGEHGQFAHVLAATLDDGWQWEASTYYHSFVLRAVECSLSACPDIYVPGPVRRRIAAMRDVLERLPYSDGQFPALHDGPWRRSGYDDEIAEIGLQHRPLRDGVDVFADAGYAMVTSAGVTGLLAFGPHGGSHGHLDKLSMSLYGPHTAWQPDPGQVPYAHRPWRTWFAGTAAHPTFSVDGMDQTECTGRLVHQDVDSVSVACDDAYPGVRAIRTLTRTSGGLLDELVVAAERECRIALQLRPDVPFVAAAGDPWTSSWVGEPSLSGTHTADHDTRLWVRPGPGSADDPQCSRTHVDWIVDDVRAIHFTSVYRVGA